MYVKVTTAAEIEIGTRGSVALEETPPASNRKSSYGIFSDGERKDGTHGLSALVRQR